MSTALLKMNAEVLGEVVQNYERLLEKKEQNAVQLQQLKNQILYLLAAIKKVNQ